MYKSLFVDKSKKKNQKYQENDLIRTADLRNTFSKGDRTNCLYILYKITQTIEDTIPSCHIDKLPERYKKALLKKA